VSYLISRGPEPILTWRRLPGWQNWRASAVELEKVMKNEAEAKPDLLREARLAGYQPTAAPSFRWSDPAR
jgi:hypothetical protein